MPEVIVNTPFDKFVAMAQLSACCVVPPAPLTVIFGMVLPFVVIVAVPLVWVKVNPVEVLPTAFTVIPEPNRKAVEPDVLMVTTALAVNVSVPVKPLKSTPCTVMLAPTFVVPDPELPSKMQKSPVPGTLALFDPPDDVAQFVLEVAAQLVEEPLPTQ